MLTLYQFPISHYCEKVRWALSYKKLDYQTKNLLPGLHSQKARKLTGLTSLPILVHDGNAVQNSSDIITYLDEKFPETCLTPLDDNLKQEALNWEKFADEQIGIPVRIICYQTLLDYPDILIPFFTANSPWYQPYLLKAAYPVLSKTMRHSMAISPETATAANQKLSAALDKICVRLENRPFLVGNQFTRADLATASLLAPLFKPKQYGLSWPEHYPEPLVSTIAHYSEKLAWANELYAKYR
ncbi:MAG: glutathione S-transferase family protein [Methyloglobulus sp.]|nr:glutathione S-transferase family protein [Methyloglobulus sp.]